MASYNTLVILAMKMHLKQWRRQRMGRQPPPPSGFDTTVFAKFVKKLIRELVRGEGMESFTLKKL